MVWQKISMYDMVHNMSFKQDVLQECSVVPNKWKMHSHNNTSFNVYFTSNNSEVNSVYELEMISCSMLS